MWWNTISISSSTKKIFFKRRRLKPFQMALSAPKTNGSLSQSSGATFFLVSGWSSSRIWGFMMEVGCLTLSTSCWVKQYFRFICLNHLLFFVTLFSNVVLFSTNIYLIKYLLCARDYYVPGIRYKWNKIKWDNSLLLLYKYVNHV